MLSIIKPRGDIKSNWDSANPVLRMREWGVEWDTTVGVGDVKIKIGDGVTPWSALDYVIVSDVTKKIVKTFAEVTAENPELTENSAMDVLWATAKKKFEYLNNKVTDISENGDIDLTEVKLPTFTEYASGDTAIPDARTAINNIQANTKMPSFFSNAKAALKGLVTLGEMRSLLVNSGLTTETGKYFLDAAYGKTLADQISQLNSTTQALADYKMNAIGMVQYPYIDSSGYVRLDDVSLSGIGTFIVDAVEKHNTLVKWYCVRANPKEGVTGYFKNGSFSILWCMSSTAYGWSILMSDTENIIIFGRLTSRVWHWYKPTLAEVN